ncbi:MBL fold metallo-hydrolase [Gordonia hydrophobica]|uniref:MBL fold metallo-hydrolase n=1 Tax=Gordonia hydrophobica TaxID=40516 RepID=A0ABZ2U4C3_9ACTN|nr:MBL fold metallo-hydrolase [Gordonia hydrophobica]MBM7367467.1 L-ascorbate metabolism protein UlaG (beta-lactamase superfamily) [Gordonia hydrophobica]
MTRKTSVLQLPRPAPLFAMGASAEAIAETTAQSPHLVDGAFANLDPAGDAEAPGFDTAVDMLRRPGKPTGVIPVLRPEFDAVAAGLAVTWLGHASAVVELDGVRIVTDPVLSARCSPSQLVGPKRMHRAPLTARELPSLDVVLISHDHYDHLDTPTIVAIADAQPDALFVVPIGVGAHLRSWGVDRSRIREADWYGDVALTVRGTVVTFHAVPARHFSGRGLARNLTQWVSWAVVGPHHRVFFSGDTGYTESYAQTGADLGPFDVTLIAVGAYDPAWPDIHLNPEEGVAVHRMLSGGERGALMVPIHWGTFNLARHAWADPVRRLTVEAERAGVEICVPRPGATLLPDSRTGTAFFDSTWWERTA